MPKAVEKLAKKLRKKGKSKSSSYAIATAAIAVSGAENNLLEITNLTNRYVRFYWDWASAGASSTVNVMYTLKS